MTSARTPVGPILEPGDELPGRAVPIDLAGIDGVYRWEGASQWCTRHGSAVVQHFQESVVYVWGAALSDGDRTDVCRSATSSGGYRRPVPGGWQLGAIEIRDDEVEFTALADQPVLVVDLEDQALLNAITSDAALMQDLQDSAMAFALHHTIQFWTIDYVGARTEFHPKYAAKFVAVVRANGEDYLDYYGQLPESMTDEHVNKVRAHLDRLGIKDAGATE